MARHTTFRFCLDPTAEQREMLARHAGASRFAYIQCLQMVKTALAERGIDPGVAVPWSGFDLISAFNAWKKTGDAGRVFTVDADGHPPVAALVRRRPGEDLVCHDQPPGRPVVVRAER
jgi:putative transposase